MTMNRRKALGIGIGGALAAAVGTAQPAAAAGGGSTLPEIYQRETAAAGGSWYSKVSVLDAGGTFQPVISDDADHVIDGASVQKLAVATAILDKVDRGLLAMDQKVTLTSDIILGGTGLYFLQGAYGDQITVAGFLTAMLLVSDNTAVRLCGSLCGTDETNAILAAKGFTYTRVEPGSSPNRFFLGKTTPNEMTDLLTRLVRKTLLSTRSCNFMLGIMRCINGYHDGVRRNMSSEERSRVAVKYGSDDDRRHEVGVMFNTAGAPVIVYGFFADQMFDDMNNYGSTHPAVQAHTALGRAMFDSMAAMPQSLVAGVPTHHVEPFVQSNGN